MARVGPLRLRKGPRPRAARSSGVILVAAAALVGCGSSDDDEKKAGTPRGPSSAALRAELAAATKVDPARFPRVSGRTLQELANGLDGAGPQLALGTSVFTTGRSRMAFGVIDRKTGFVYAPTVIYVADRPLGVDGAKARGPFAAPADLLVTDPPYRSRQAATEKSPTAAIYDAAIDVDRPGIYNVLSVSLINGQLVGAAGQIKVVDPDDDPIPAPGERAPRVATDTKASAGGDIASIDTRLPPDSQHDVSLDAVIGKRPVALLFATPQLCASRVCGPVVDIAAQLQAKYGDRMTFIHQEVYRDNDRNKGLRPPLVAFKLQSEPWLFTLDAEGRVVTRLEGSFGFRAFEQAVKAAL